MNENENVKTSITNENTNENTSENTNESVKAEGVKDETQTKVGEEKTTTVETTETKFSDGEGEKDKTEDTTIKAEEEKKRNSDFAQKRREKEKREQEQKDIARKAELSGIKKALKGVNPYTNEALETDEDIEHYLIQVEMEEKQLDPNSLTDFRKFKKLQVEKTQPMSEAEWVANDSKDFQSKFPDITFDEIFQEKDFLDYVEKYYKEEIGKAIPLSKIYGNFKTYKQDRADFDKLVIAKANEMFEKRMAKKESSVGVLANKNGDGSNEPLYTLEQLKKLTPKEVSANWERVQKSYKHINGNK